MRHIYIIVTAIILCILIRIPNLNRPLSKHHEFISAHVLRVLTIWKEGGIAHYHFAPVMNYEGLTNKYINNQSMGYYDKHGDYYYLSYPPFAFIFPYLIFSIFQIPFTPLALQILNMLLHITGSLVLYHIILLLINDDRKKIIASFSVAFFLLNPCSLWFQANVFFGDMLVILFWLIAVYLVLTIKNEKNISVKYLLLLLVLMFGNYTEYLMFTFSIATGIYILSNRYKHKSLLILILLAGIIIPLLITTLQYSSITDLKSFLLQSKGRYLSRSGYSFFRWSTVIFEIRVIIYNYLVHYFGFILLFIVAELILLFRKQKHLYFNKSAFIFLFIIPILSHHFIFLNASMHDFQVLKSIVPISIMAAYILFALADRKLILIIASLTLLINIGDYYFINKPGKTSRNGDAYSSDKEIAEVIKPLMKEDEVIFINTDVTPQTIYYAHRNIKPAYSTYEAKLFLKKISYPKGTLFYFDTMNHLVKTAAITN